MNKKRIIITLVAVSILIAGGWFLLTRFNKTTVTISSEEGAQIFISRFNDDSKRFEYEELGSGEVTLHLAPGVYSFRTVKDQRATEGVVEVKEDNIKRHFPLKSSSNKERLLYGVAYDVVKSADKFRFYDPRFNMLFNYSERGGRPERMYLPIEDIVDVEWLNYNHGFIKTVRDYYVYEQGSVRRLGFPERNVEGDERVVDYGYDANKKNSFAININGNVYLYKNNFQNRQRVAGNSEGLVPQLSDTNDVLLYNGELANVEEAIEDKFLLLKAPNYSSKSLGNQGPISAEWGNKPGVVALINSSEVKVLDINNGNTQTVISHPISNTSSVIWVHNNVLLYHYDQTIWAHNTKDGLSYKLVDAEEEIDHRNPFYQQGGTLYYSSTATGDNEKDINLFSVDISNFLP